MRRSPHQTYMGDFDVKNKMCDKHPASLSFRRCRGLITEKESWTRGDPLLEAHEDLRQTLPVVPPVADGPGVSMITRPAATEARQPLRTGEDQRWKMRRSQTRSLATRWDNRHAKGPPRKEPTCTTKITRHEAEP